MRRGSKRPYWIRRTHLFRADEFICSHCGSIATKAYACCPGCGAQMSTTKYDPHWVAEMEMMDILFDDDVDW